MRAIRCLALAAAAVIPLAACSESAPSGPQVPEDTPAPSENIAHGPFFPECGGISDQEVIKQTEVPGW